MKKLIAMLLALTVLLTMAACGGETPAPDATNPVVSEPQPTEAETDAPTEATEPEETEPTVPDHVGWKDFYFRKADETAKVLIRFPITYADALGLTLVRNDLFIVDGYKEGNSPEVNSVSEVFPAYFDQVESKFAYEYALNYSDAEFTLESSESVGNINGYEMYKFIGTHSYTFNDYRETNKFVAYATQLQGNGAYIYWFAQDTTDDQSMFETLEEYAHDMALTLKEVED